MCQEKDILRLINCLEGSFILHAFVLSLSQFWHPIGNSSYSFQSTMHEPMTVRLIAEQPPSALLPVSDMTDHAHLLMAEQVARSPGVSSSTKLTTPIFHTANELTRMPEMIGQPPEAMEIGQGASGEVVFKLSINRLGIVTQLQRVKSTLPRDIEGKLAFQLYRNEYRAGEIDDVAVDSEMIVDLRLESGGWLTDQLPVLRQDKSQEQP